MFELTFVGAALVKQFPRHRRWHKTVAQAVQAAYKILLSLPNRSVHPAIVYGPGLGKDGMTIA